MNSLFKSIKPNHVGMASVAVACFLLCLKIWAYIQTDSAAVLSSLLDSGLDLLVSLMTWASIQYSMRPPDDDHRYGHGKIEGVSALSQAVFMSAGAALLVFEGFYKLINPMPISSPMIGVSVMVISIMMTLLLIKIQSATMVQHRSLAIEADRGHYTGDAMINGSTIVILLLIPLTGWVFLDALFALCIAGVTAWIAFDIGKKAINMLLDREVEPDIKHAIAHVILDDKRIKHLHDLRVIRHGMQMVITYDIELDGSISLNNAHDIATESEDRVLALYPRADIMVHMDPEGADHSRRHHVREVFEQP